LETTTGKVEDGIKLGSLSIRTVFIRRRLYERNLQVCLVGHGEIAIIRETKAWMNDEKDN
jgi:hypothetical protein